MNIYNITSSSINNYGYHDFGLFEGRTKNEALVELYLSIGQLDIGYDEKNDIIIYPDENTARILGSSADFTIKEKSRYDIS